MTGGAGGGLSQTLAAFVVDSRWEDMSPQVREQATRSIVNGFGTALGGSSDQAILRLIATVDRFSGERTSTVIGHDKKMDMATAAFLNAASMNVFDFDDTHEGTIIHPTAPVAAAVLALAEARNISGKDLLHAFILGTEIECRLGNAISPGHYDRGWHITATCGVFGAAAAVGKLLGLDSRQMLWAFGNASAQSSGLVETLGSMAKSVGVGNAGRNGVLAALMAQNGVEGPLRPLEGPRGFLNVTSDTPDFAAVTGGLGDTWELTRNAFKPYPCGVVLNPVIDACLAARLTNSMTPDVIERIVVIGGPLLKARADRPNVTSGREAQVSAQHAVAVSLLRGSAGIVDFNDEAVSAPDVLALRAKVQAIEVDSATPVESARVQFYLLDGRMQETVVDVATGSLKKPLSDDDLERKFRTLAAYGCPGLTVDPLIEMLWDLARSPDVARVMAAARPTSAGGK